MLQIFQALEHPVEEEKLLELQSLVIMERENFVRFIFNGSWNSVVHRENIDLKLLDYEQTVAVAATSGIDMQTKDVIYQWSYIQAVFFTSTILTTIGKKPINHHKNMNKKGLCWRRFLKKQQNHDQASAIRNNGYGPLILDIVYCYMH